MSEKERAKPAPFFLAIAMCSPGFHLMDDAGCWLSDAESARPLPLARLGCDPPTVVLALTIKGADPARVVEN